MSGTANMDLSQAEAGQHQEQHIDDSQAPSVPFFEGPNESPFRKAVVKTESSESEPGSDSIRLETDEEQFRGHMEWFGGIEGMGPLPDDDGEAHPNGYIHFDENGKMWYKESGQSEWEPAVFHYWIRHELGQNQRGPYISPRKHGVMKGDETCQSNIQRTWGVERQQYPDIMFEYLPHDVPSVANPGLCMFYGMVVIDFWLSPVKDYCEFPSVLSSQYEGEYMEPTQRYNREITYQDFRARMPPILREGSGSRIVMKPLYSANALAGRARRFRERVGAITWRAPKRGSAAIQTFMSDRLTGLLGADDDNNNNNNSNRDRDVIRSLPNLTTKEVATLRLVGMGKEPGRAKASATERQKRRYVHDVKRQAGVPSDDLRR